MNLTLRWHGKAGDGKAAFVVADQNDGWKDLRIELDTDDCDSDFARAAMQEIIDRVNRANEVESKAPVHPGKGYRFIDLTKDSPQDGDQWWEADTQSWHYRERRIEFSKDITYRRKDEATLSPE